MKNYFNATEVEKKISYTFKDKQLLEAAFVHRSFLNEHPELVSMHNERLEFLGDSILGLIVAEYLYIQMPDVQEGVLSDLRSRLVESSACVSYLHKLEVTEALLLGRGEQMNDGRGRESILADLFEAIMGAIYLDGGLEAVKHFFFAHFLSEVDRVLAQPPRNWKAELQDYTQRRCQQTPHYEVLEESGPSHQKVFKVAVFIDKTLCGVGEGSSKKIAQQLAAQDALSKI